MVQKCIAITMWKLAITDFYKSVGNQFRVGKSMVGTVDIEVCKAINAVQTPTVVKIGSIPKITAEFAQMCPLDLSLWFLSLNKFLKDIPVKLSLSRPCLMIIA